MSGLPVDTWEGEQSARAHARILFHQTNRVVELRALGVDNVPGAGIVSGYFTETEKLIEAAASLDGKATGIYVTINPARPDLLSRAPNHVVFAPKKTTSDTDILHRRILLIDVDSHRPPGVSATEKEREHAAELADQILDYLATLGFPEPAAAADSGNGWHIQYLIDLPSDDAGLLTQVLETLAFRFNTDRAQVDLTVVNPARICKFYGTLTKKGNATPERPHRRSQLLSAPESPVTVPRQLLQKLAEGAPSRAKPTRVSVPTRMASFNVEGFLSDREIGVVRAGSWKDGRRWVLAVCPLNSDHDDGAAYIVQFANGFVAAGCHHNGCSGKTWNDFRDALDPGWRERAPASVDSVSRDESDWPEPQPLPRDLPPVVPFSLSLLPVSLREWIGDIADRIQCPLDFPAVAAMVALAGVVGRKLGIRPKRHDDWLVVPNLWGAVIGRPGVLKTPAIQEPLKPLRRLEIRAKDEFDRETKSYEAEKLVADAKKKQSSEAIKKALKNHDARVLEIAEKSVDEEPKEPTRSRYLVNDSTVEKLGEILNQNPNGVVCYRDELTGLLWSLDREGQEGARAFYLEAWNGNGRYTYDRIGRGTIDIEAAIVSIIGAIQPGPLRGYLRQAVAQSEQDDGLMQRFQLAVWPDVSQKWINVDRWPNSDARRTANAMFDRIAGLDPRAVGATTDEHEPDGIPFVRFSSCAQDLFDEWRECLENSVRSGEEHPAIESHLAKYRSLVPSLALLIHLADSGTGSVEEKALRMAIDWADYLESHARRIFSVAMNLDAHAARALAQKILKLEVRDGFALREVYRPQWAGLADRDTVAKAVALLVDLEWLAEQRLLTAGAPKTTFLVNPRIWSMPPEATDKTDKSSSTRTSGSSGSAPEGVSADLEGLAGDDPERVSRG